MTNRPKIISLNSARCKKDQEEEQRLERLVIERWTGPRCPDCGVSVPESGRCLMCKVG